MYFSDTFNSLGVFIGMHVKSSKGKGGVNLLIRIW